MVIVTLALLLGINALMDWSGALGAGQRQMAACSVRARCGLGSAVVTAQQLGMAGVLVLVMLIVYAFFRFTELGLRMRAAAQNPGLGPPAWHPGWDGCWRSGGAWRPCSGRWPGCFGPNDIGLDPNTMSGVLLFAFAAAAFGGFNSMLGAVLGGIVVGVSQNLGATYIPAIGHDLDLVVPFLIILLVLLVRANRSVRTRQRGGGVKRVAIGAVAVLALLLAPLVADYFTYQAAQVLVYAIAVMGLALLIGYTGQISVGHGALFAVGAYTTAILWARFDVPYPLATSWPRWQALWSDCCSAFLRCEFAASTWRWSRWRWRCC